MRIIEFRQPEIYYTDETGRVIAQLKSHKSAVYTKLAQKLGRIEELEKEIKQLKEDVKQSTREDIADLFDAEDIVSTRIVDTVSFIFTLTKNPKETEAPKYKEILNELEKSMTPELIVMLESLKKTMVTRTQKAPALSYEKKPDSKLHESVVNSIFSKVKNFALRWAKRYDTKLEHLQQLLHS